MQLEDLGQIHAGYDHVYLSPHLDDATLSCGGAIARHIDAGARVLVVTLATAAPPPNAPLSRFAHDHHLMWGFAPERAMAERQREDDMALDCLGADTYRAGMLDAIYRVPEAYTDNNRLFGTPVDDDPLSSSTQKLVAALKRCAPHATFYAPLGVGNHVDHQIIHSAAHAAIGPALAFYEDFPYVLSPGAIERRMRALARRFVPSTVNIDATLTRKIGAIGAYASQISSLFEAPDAFAQIITDYAKNLRPENGTYGERIWLRDVQ
jgi:LmbE family N-acetylglucosaminyl deacetylase